MIIEEVNEKNFKEQVEKLEEEVEIKLKNFERQKINKNVNLFSFFDPTIFSYQYLRDKQNNSMKLRGFQNKIINDKAEVIVMAAANQLGKTTTAVVKVLHHAMLVPNASVLIISRSEPQAIYILDEVRWTMRRSGIKWQPIMDEVENRTEIHITNEDGKGVSVIRCLPPTQRVLAYPATLIICDEIGFWEIENMKQTEYYNKVIRSRIQETKEWKIEYKGVNLNNFFTFGQIFCISSTNAQQGILWYNWNISSYNQYRFCWLSKKGRTLEEYNKIKLTMPSDEFDSVFAAEFSSASGGFITLLEYNDAIDKEAAQSLPISIPVYPGADFAGEDTVSRDVDGTVLFASINVKEDKIDKVKVVYTNGFPLRCKKEVVYDELKKFHSIGIFAYDKAGVGDSVKNDLIDSNILPEYKIEALTYSLPNKSEVYYNMKRLFEQRRVIIPDIPKLKEQLLGLRFEKTEGGHIKVHHAREGLHDDWADALANSLWAANRGSGIPVDVTIVNPSKEKVKKEKYKNRGELVVCSSCADGKWSNRACACSDF